MNDYEIQNARSHAFQCNDYPEALEAINTWWSTKSNIDVINAIVFRLEDDYLSVEVHWAEG